jgi:DNA polymerase, archaea type
MTDINKLIYGKDQTERIVSIEVEDGNAELFIQEQDGSISTQVISNKYWLLSSRNLGANWIRLKGDLHYKYGIQFNTRAEFNKVRSALKDQDVYTIADPKENCMVNKGITYYKGLKPNEVSILSFDIETTGLDGTRDKLLLISNTYRNHKGEITRKLFSYDEFESEGVMLDAWSNWVNLVDPSIICGHNIYGFDLPFLQAVADRNNTTITIGRDASPIKFNEYDSKFRKDGSQSYSYKKVKCYGRELVDTMFLAIKYDVGRKYESYGLKKIIEQEGIRVEGRVMYDASKIKDNYNNPVEWEKIKAYCIHDSDESLALFDLMIAPTFYMTRSVPKPFQLMIESATGSQLNSIMIRAYLQDKHSIPKASEIENYPGGISEAIPGVYKNCMRFDVASLYPSIILQYEIGVGEKDPNNYFVEMVKYFTNERLNNKRLAKETGLKYYDDLQSSQKVAINSAYGFLGASGLNFNAPKSAAAVTNYGREILTKAIKWATNRDIDEIQNPKN